MRVITVSLVLAVSYGCESSQSAPFTPFAPTTPQLSPNAPRPSPTPVNVQYWRLTRTLAEVAGRICAAWNDPEVGRSSNWILEIRRSNTDIMMMYEGDPTDPVERKGSVIGDAFDVNFSRRTYQPCGGSRLDYQFQSRVVGRFIADGQEISARETWSYRTDSGEERVLHYDWSAQLWLDYGQPQINGE
jgi:hypothetical protein